MSSIKHFLAVGSLILMGAAAPVSYGDNHSQPTDSQAMQKQQSAAQVVLQQDQQLSITIHAPIQNLFRYTQWEGKPAKLDQLKDSSGHQLESFRKAIRDLFRKELKITVNGKALSAKKVRLPNLVQIKQALRPTNQQERRAPAPPPPPPRPNNNDDRIADYNGIPAEQRERQAGQGRVPPRQSESYMDNNSPNMRPQPPQSQPAMVSYRDSVAVRVRGLIPEEIKNPQLEIQFPKAVGKVMVSYSRPQVQNIKHGGRYIQRLD